MENTENGFICEHCNTRIIGFGMIQSTGCSHYPISLFTKTGPKLEKPGVKPPNKKKTKQITTNNIERGKNLNCRNCDIETGTEVYRHPESTRIKALMGGGIMGGKNPHHSTAYLCDGLKCGIRFDKKPNLDEKQGIVNARDLWAFEMIFKTWNI